MPGEIRNPALRKLAGEIERVKRHAQATAGGLSQSQLDWQPQPDSWSVGQCLEHLVKSHEAYQGVVPQKIAKARSAGATATHAEWKPGVMGGFLIRGVTPGSRPVRTFKVFTPDPIARPDVLAAFLKREDELVEWMYAADGLDLTRIRLSSAAFWLFRYHLGDFFTILTVHAERHLQQADRVKAQPGFPRT